MAEYIEYHIALINHHKVARLAKMLDCHYAEALGAVSLLWVWATTQNREDGYLDRFTPDEIVAGCRYEGAKDSTLFVKALQDSKLLDPDMKIHDWEKHGTRILRESRERARKHREKLKLEGKKEGTPYEKLVQESKKRGGTEALGSVLARSMEGIKK